MVTSIRVEEKKVLDGWKTKKGPAVHRAWKEGKMLGGWR